MKVKYRGIMRPTEDEALRRVKAAFKPYKPFVFRSRMGKKERRMAWAR